MPPGRDLPQQDNFRETTMSEASKRQEMVPAMSAVGAALSRKRLSGIGAARGLALIGLTAIHYLPALVAGVGLGRVDRYPLPARPGGRGGLRKHHNFPETPRQIYPRGVLSRMRRQL